MQEQTQRQSDVAGERASEAPFGFDRTLAEFPTRKVPARQVVDLLHVSHRPDCIAEYRRAMQRGDLFPPVSVLRLGRRLFVADGHKRFQAYLSLQAGEIVVEIWPVRRWLRDQGRQLAGKTRQQWRLATRSLVDPVARAQARRLFWDTVRHWKRLVSSLFLYSRRRGGL